MQYMQESGFKPQTSYLFTLRVEYLVNKLLKKKKKCDSFINLSLLTFEYIFDGILMDEY